MAITDPATQRYNSRLKEFNDAVAKHEEEFNRCHAAGDEVGASKAEVLRSDATIKRDALMKFKENLTKFVLMYEYIAQLVEFSDPELESFAGYARLLRNRLKNINPEEIDLKGLKLTHYAIKGDGSLEGVSEGQDGYGVLRPVSGLGTGEPRDRERAFLSELIEKLNDLFGEGITDKDKVMFAVHISEKLRSNETVMAQVNNNTREQALKADLPDAATDAIVEALSSHKAIAERLLSDASSQGLFYGLLYDILKKSDASKLLNPREIDA